LLKNAAHIQTFPASRILRPKIDVKLVDVWAVVAASTVQSTSTAGAFELEYVGEDGARHQRSWCIRPVRLRRALFASSLSTMPSLPAVARRRCRRAWCPSSERIRLTPRRSRRRLRPGLRVEVDDRNEKMNAKIRDFANQKTPYILVFATRKRRPHGQRPYAGQGRPGSMPWPTSSRSTALVRGSRRNCSEISEFGGYYASWQPARFDKRSASRSISRPSTSTTASMWTAFIEERDLGELSSVSASNSDRYLFEE